MSGFGLSLDCLLGQEQIAPLIQIQGNDRNHKLSPKPVSDTASSRFANSLNKALHLPHTSGSMKELLFTTLFIGLW